MTKVPLRAYIRDIESAIEEGQIEEAVTHCRHILKTFSKNIKAYRLLGKAYLESQKLGDAADIFQRVLSAIPDDFISHVGMSIVREDEGNLDTALWHMQRAFDVQPYNAAIQGEIRRLYNKRDRIEPPKVRLTRGALARLYNKGGNYQQAIGELTEAIKEGEERPDLLVVLAEAYDKNGDKIKAMEVCNKLILELPYCMVANRILARLLEGTDREKDRKTCQQRLAALDPYEAHTSPKAPTAADVPDQAVMIEQLAWGQASERFPAEEQAEWGSPLEAELGASDSGEEELPEWAVPRSQSEEFIPPAEESPSEEEGEEEIPDWMREAGWEPSNGEAAEPPPAYTFDEEDEVDVGEAVAADIPAWMQEMAPSEDAEDQGEEDLDELESIFSGQSAGEEDETPDWLEAEVESEQPEASPAEEEVPDWLQEMGDEVSPQAETEPEAEPEPSADELATELGEDELPDWLRDMDVEASPQAEAETEAEPEPEPEPSQPPTPEPAAEAEGEDLPDWLREMEGEPAPQAEAEPKPEAERPAPEPAAEAEEDELPDWINQMAAEAPETETQPASEAAQAEDELPAWLDELEGEALPEEAQEEQEPSLPEPPAEKAEAAEDFPEWLAQPEDAEASLETVSPEPEGEADFPAWISEPDESEEKMSKEPTAEQPEEMPEETPEPDFEDADAAMAWLEGLAAKQGVSEEELLSKPEERSEVPPDWAQAGPVDTAEEEPPEAEKEEKPEEAETIETAPPSFEEVDRGEEQETIPLDQFDDADEAMAWLEGLAAKQGVSEEELLSKPEERGETPPKWAQEPQQVEEPSAETSEEEIEQPEAEEVEEAEELEETPEWLRDLEPEPRTEAPLPGETAEAKLETDDEELPEWLRELEEAQAAEEGVPEPPEVPEAAAEPETVATEEAEEVEEAEEDLPEWLRDLEKEPEEEEIPWEPEEVAEVTAEGPEAKDEEYVWQPPEEPVEEAKEIEPEEVEPEEIEPVELNTASLADLEKIPGIGFRLAQHIINYRQESGPYETVKDLLNVSTISADILKQISDYIVVEAPQPEEAPAEPQIEPEDEHHAKQLRAQAHLKAGNIDEAMELYDQLIKKSKRIKEIIEDLNQASYQHPVNANILQTLGDAYMRDDQLQEALDTYSKAENLLR